MTASNNGLQRNRSGFFCLFAKHEFGNNIVKINLAEKFKLQSSYVDTRRWEDQVIHFYGPSLSRKEESSFNSVFFVCVNGGFEFEASKKVPSWEARITKSGRLQFF